MQNPRQLLTDLYLAAVAGALPERVVREAIPMLPLYTGTAIRIIAIGKAAHAMATGAIAGLRDIGREPTSGVIVGPTIERAPHPSLQVVMGDHPIPAENSLAAANAIGEAVSQVRSNDDVIVLISGGGSSLAAAPASDDLTQKDLGDLYTKLLASGDDIIAMNTVRRQYARWSGGRLALALHPARVHTLIVSDVPGDDPAMISSGPCTPDADMAKDPRFANVTTRVIVSNAHARQAAAARARSANIDEVTVVPTPLTGEASIAGVRLASELIARHKLARGPKKTRCLIWGGETTVTLTSPNTTSTNGESPLGGRNQELALAAARSLADAGDHSRDIALLAAGTDGRDGPTDAAGAIVTAHTWGAIEGAGRNPAQDLATHNAYRALDAAHALLRTGHSGTNVMDVVIGVIL